MDRAKLSPEDRAKEADRVRQAAIAYRETLAGDIREARERVARAQAAQAPGTDPAVAEEHRGSLAYNQARIRDLEAYQEYLAELLAAPDPLEYLEAHPDRPALAGHSH